MEWLAAESTTQLNNYLCFGIGASANLALIWLIRRHSTSSLRPYASVLLVKSAIDLLYLLSIVSFQSVGLHF